MRLNVNPNRMELLKIKKRLIIARRGHKLLKSKQDELVQQFIPLIKETVNLQKEVSKEMSYLYQKFAFARGLQLNQFLENSLKTGNIHLKIKLQYSPVLNLRIPDFSPEFDGEICNYSFINTRSELDTTLISAKKILELLLKLSSSEKKVILIAQEIEKTRRRVNALEYIFIPNLLETIKYITVKLAEVEKDNLVRLMKIKEMVRSH